MALVPKNKKRSLNDNDLTNKDSKRIRKITQCSLGSCGDLKEYNVCRFERPFGVLIDKTEIAKEIFEPVDKRFYSFPLLQERNKKFESLRILDFAAQFKLVSFTPSGDYGVLVIPGTETRLTKLFAPFKISIYLVQICDETLAKKQDLTIEDVLVDPSNIEYHQFKESIKPIMENPVVIPCDSSCWFNHHTITMCRKFTKDEEKVCILSQETGESIIYNTANLRFIILVDYMDFLYQTNINNKEMPYSEKIKLGNDATAGGAGIPVFFTKGLLEVAYTPDSANYSTMEKMAETLKNEILEGVLDGIKARNDVKDEDDGDV